jgi:hypothetical protein
MKLNSKLTGGLAWAGLVVVLAVPSADLLTGKKDGDSAKVVAPASAADTDTVQTAAIETVKAPNPQPTIKRGVQTASQDPVDAYVSSGKKLPSYISDAPADTASTKPVVTPKLVVPASSSTTSTTTLQPVEDTQVAALPQAEEAPIPYPASKRPKTQTTAVAATAPVAITPLQSTTPVKTTTIVAPATGVTPDATAATPTTNVASTATVTSADEKPLILDEDVIERRDEAVAKVLDEEPQDQPQVAETQQPRRVEGDQLEEWDSGSLADYLERKGLMNGNDASTQASRDDDANYDPDGFFLDDGPNNDRSDARVIRRVKRNNDFFFF